VRARAEINIPEKRKRAQHNEPPVQPVMQMSGASGAMHG
jgi:hypothetical protein